MEIPDTFVNGSLHHVHTLIDHILYGFVDRSEGRYGSTVVDKSLPTVSISGLIRVGVTAVVGSKKRAATWYRVDCSDVILC